MTQKELAKILYVTDSTISHYEQGINVPTTEMVIKLAKIFDVTTDYLLILITILTQDKIIVKMVITPETLLTN
ncbi:MAG: helix-turn-helix transcriptional regulator [Ruminiclostridium sp.]|nr:helix-turn-helix transcriptional regulator [Ruminiclostridium sp.]